MPPGATYIVIPLICIIICLIMLYWGNSPLNRLIDRLFGWDPYYDLNHKIPELPSKRTRSDEEPGQLKLANLIRDLAADEPVSLLAGERERPPRAEFFGKMDGKPVSEEGMYEERYLNEFERKHWQQKLDKAKKELDQENKKAEPVDLFLYKGTK